MRRALLLLVCMAAFLAATNTASAGWFHFHRPFRHLHHVRHHVHRWFHRPHYYHRHHVHRYRYYGPRYYSYGPRFYGYSFGYRSYHFPLHHVIRHFAPLCYPTRVYYYAPTCSTTTYGSWSYAASQPSSSLGPTGRELPDATRLARISERAATTESATRDAGESNGRRDLLASLRREMDRVKSELSREGAAATWEQLTRQQQLVELGDRLFRGRFYDEALGQYEAASKRSPASAELHLRRGHALVALGRYEQAARAFKRALVLNPRQVGSEQSLTELYGAGNRRHLDRHVETLAGAALQDARDGDLFFLLGVCLHFDGQGERAAKFFEQAGRLGEPSAAHLQPFLRNNFPREGSPSGGATDSRDRWTDAEPAGREVASVALRR